MDILESGIFGQVLVRVFAPWNELTKPRSGLVDSLRAKTSTRTSPKKYRIPRCPFIYLPHIKHFKTI